MLIFISATKWVIIVKEFIIWRDKESEQDQYAHTLGHDVLRLVSETFPHFYQIQSTITMAEVQLSFGAQKHQRAKANRKTTVTYQPSKRRKVAERLLSQKIYTTNASR